jgi:hypothetical protein
VADSVTSSFGLVLAWRCPYLDCAGFIRMQGAEITDIPRRCGAECARRRIGRNLVRHEKCRVSGDAGPVRLRIIVSPDDVVARQDIGQRIRIEGGVGGWIGFFIDIDQPLKGHASEFLLAITHTFLVSDTHVGNPCLG